MLWQVVQVAHRSWQYFMVSLDNNSALTFRSKGGLTREIEGMHAGAENGPFRIRCATQ